MKSTKITALFLALLMLLTGCAFTEKPEAPSGAEQSGPVSSEPGKTENPEESTAKPAENYETLSVEAVYPQAVGAGMSPEDFIMDSSYSDWWTVHHENVIRSSSLGNGMDGFYQAILGNMLTGDTIDNSVCSPLNLYLAFSMLAEVSGGSSREQILHALGAESIESLRERVSALWSANYADTPTLKSLLADSIWLSNSFPYREETLSRLAQDYFASSFVGEMGSDEFNRKLQEWTDANTGGLLSEYTKNLTLQPETVLALVSTIYYKAAWNDEFSAGKTDQQVFHGVTEDRLVSMMHSDRMSSYYLTDRFSAVSLGLTDSGSMYFFLPSQGVSLEDLAEDPDVLRICRGTVQAEGGNPIIHLSVPKFEVSQKTDLQGTLLGLGITDVMDPEKSDFSPLTDDPGKIALSSAEHAAMVKIDEDGVTGAAYTALALAGAAMTTNEVYFTLDRPFLFAVKGQDGSILFAGVIRNL